MGNQRWSLDFVADQFTDGRRFRILEVYDDCTRECLALVADTSIGGRRVARELDASWLGAGSRRHRQRQRHGTDVQRHPGMGRPAQGRLALHRSRQAPAERLQREFQRQAARRTAERDPVQLPVGPAPCSKTGGATSTRCGLTRASATSLPPTTPALFPERTAGALRTPTTPRAGLLPAAIIKVQINSGLSLWLDEKWGSGQRSVRMA
jgi:hypothetical protein